MNIGLVFLLGIITGAFIRYREKRIKAYIDEKMDNEIRKESD